MNAIEGAGIAGELLSWIGLGLGLTLLLAGTLLRSKDRALVPTEIVIVRGPHAPLARWFAAGEFHERPLRPTEGAHYAGRDDCTGYVSPQDPSDMRFERHRPATSVCRALGIALVVIGLGGFALSIVPLVLP